MTSAAGSGLDRGRYEIVKTLAATPWSTVHEVYDNELQKRFAAKVLRVDGAQAEIVTAMWERECAALDGLTHASIIRLERYFRDGERLVLILELVPQGYTLAGLIEDCANQKRVRPSPLWRLQHAVKLLSAIAAAHQRNVIHRDIKPGNVLVVADHDAEQHQLKLADFGVSLVLALTARGGTGVTLRDFHTRPYAAPEQLLQRNVSTPADVYSFAVLCAAMLSLEPAREETDAEGVRRMLMGAKDEYLSSGASSGPLEQLGHLLSKCLSESPNQRPRLPELERCFEAVLGQVKPPQQAGVKWTHTAEEKMAAAGYADAGALLADLNHQLRVTSKDGDRGLLIDCFGRTSFVRLTTNGTGKPLKAIDVRRKPAHEHDLGRRAARPCSIELADKPIDGTPLAEFAELARSDERAASTEELIACADKVIRFEQDRLARLRASYDMGADARGSSEGFLQARGAGLSSPTLDRVLLKGLVEIPLIDLRPWSKRGKSKARQAAEQATGHAAEEAPDADILARTEKLSPFFERPEDIVVKASSGGRLTEIGRAVGFDDERLVLKVRIIGRPTSIRRVGELQLINDQADRVLQKQRAALDTLKAQGAVRQDLFRLLYDANAHRLGEASPVQLVQNGLVGSDELAFMVQNILAAEGLFLVQGPPGAGKTTLIAEVVMQALARNSNTRIGIVSQANEAVFNVYEKLLELFEQCGKRYIACRDVRDERAQEEGPTSGFNSAYAAFAQEAARNVRATTSMPIIESDSVLNPWTTALDNGSHGMRDEFAGLVQAWCVTLLRSPSCLDKSGADAFDLLIIDEAAKATVAETLVALVRARRVLMVGDHRQLPPYLDSTTEKELEQAEIKAELAKRSLFEHLFEIVPANHRSVLRTQFRMHRTIGKFVRDLFYRDIDLKHGTEDEKRSLPDGLFNRTERVFHVNVRGAERKAGKTTLKNDEEIDAVFSILERLDRDAKGWTPRITVAVMAAYKGQVKALKRRLDRKRWWNLDVQTATVDSFQGRQADVVIYSTVRTSAKDWVFIGDARRLNVAFSRPKRLLVLVGQRENARQTPILRGAIDLMDPKNLLELEALK